MIFSKWLDIFIDEKELNTDTVFEIEGDSGTNYIPMAVIIEHIKRTSREEQIKIKGMLVRIDFCNSNIMDYFEHLAGAIAR